MYYNLAGEGIWRLTPFFGFGEPVADAAPLLSLRMALRR
jgi:hypothetical protein